MGIYLHLRKLLLEIGDLVAKRGNEIRARGMLPYDRVVIFTELFQLLAQPLELRVSLAALGQLCYLWAPVSNSNSRRCCRLCWSALIEGPFEGTEGAAR